MARDFFDEDSERAEAFNELVEHADRTLAALGDDVIQAAHTMLALGISAGVDLRDPTASRAAAFGYLMGADLPPQDSPLASLQQASKVIAALASIRAPAVIAAEAG